MSCWYVVWYTVYDFGQIADLKKKQENQSQLLRQKQRSEESAKRLLEEIQRIKTHKVIFFATFSNLLFLFTWFDTCREGSTECVMQTQYRF